MCSQMMAAHRQESSPVVPTAVAEHLDLGTLVLNLRHKDIHDLSNGTLLVVPKCLPLLLLLLLLRLFCLVCVCTGRCLCSFAFLATAFFDIVPSSSPAFAMFVEQRCSTAMRTYMCALVRCRGSFQHHLEPNTCALEISVMSNNHM